MKKRTASWFANEVRKQINRAPARAVRFDITEDEEPLIFDVLDALKRNGDDRPRLPYRCKWTAHADPTLRKQGLRRAAFFGPDYQWPVPVTTVTVPWPPVKDNLAANKRARASFDRMEKVKRQYGRDYHIELVPYDPPPRLQGVAG